MPAQRTLEALRRRGYRAGKTERWIEQVKRRVDLFGFIDLIALPPASEGRRMIGIQACAGSGLSEHLKKITDDCHEAARDWLIAGARIQIWAWRSLKPLGAKRKLWKAIIVGLAIGYKGRIVESYRREL